jgi:hypothetical protein
MSFSMGDLADVEKTLDMLFPGTKVSWECEAEDIRGPTLLIRYPENKMYSKIPLFGSRSEIAERIVESANRYEASIAVVKDEEVHTDTGDTDL